MDSSLSVSTDFMLIPVIFMLAIVIACFVAFARRFGWMVSLAVTGGGMMLLMMSLFAVSVTHDVVVVSDTHDQSRLIASPPSGFQELGHEEPFAGDSTVDEAADSAAPYAWEEGVPHVANVYPGIADCGRPLAAKLVKHLQAESKSKDDEPIAEAESPAKYQIWMRNSGLDSPDYLNFLIQFREEFTTSFPGSLVDDLTGGRPHSKSKDANKEKQHQRLDVTVYDVSDGKSETAKWDGHKQNHNKSLARSGQVVCVLRRKDRTGKIEFVSDFIEKPWVANAEKFATQYMDRKFVLGFSPRLATSEQEARVSALRDVNIKLARSGGKIFKSISLTEQSVLDRFVQKLTKPYGSVWREAVLVDCDRVDESAFLQFEDSKMAERVAASPSSSDVFEYQKVIQQHVARTHPETSEAVDSVADVGIRRRLDRSRNPESMVAGLMMLTIVIGWVSNWLTQGYYRKPLWTVTGTLLSLGFFFLILIVLISFV